MPITHTFVSGKGDVSDSTLVRPSNWNADHLGGVTVIADTLLGSDTANFDFTSISGSYRHLLVILSARSDRSGNVDDFVAVRLNNDSGANYDCFFAQFFNGSTNSAFTEDTGATSFAHLLYVPGATATSGYAGGGQIWIPDYAGTTFHKHVSAQGFTKVNTNRVITTGGDWHSTSAVTRVTIFPLNGSNWKTGSRATLYGYP